MVIGLSVLNFGRKMAKKHPVETEVKIKISRFDLPTISDRIEKAGGTLVKDYTEGNVILDTKGLNLKNKHQVLRLREKSGCDEVELTFKDKSKKVNKISSRTEITSTCSDITSITSILNALGFNEVFSYMKRRVSYKVGNSLVEIDEIPYLGYFLEIEASSHDNIEKTIKKLKLTNFKRESKSYISLLKKEMKRLKIQGTAATF
jgi:adenylate cyclase class 2